MVKDYYLILEVAADADPGTIKSSYRRLAKKYHPDLNPSHDAQERMKALTEAYSVLSDEHKRTLYDRKRMRYASEYTETYHPPPPRKSRKEAYAEIKISETLVADAIKLSRVNLILTSSLLQRRFGLEYDHASKLFKTLIRRGYVDEDGRWTAKAKYASSPRRASDARKGDRSKRSASESAEDEAMASKSWQEFRISEQLVSQAIQISRTNHMLTVGLLQKRLGLEREKAERLFSLLTKRGFIDDIGVWTDEARQRAKTKASTHAVKPNGAAKHAESKREPDLTVSEEMILRVTALGHNPRVLSIAYLERRFDLDYIRAARLFEVLVKRGIIDRRGHWLEATA